MKPPKLKAGKRCHCGCGKRAVAVFFKNGHHYGSWSCADTAQRLATQPHDISPSGTARFRYVPTVLELKARGFVRLEKEGVRAERWLMPAACKGGKRGRFYVERFRGVLITTRAYVCYSKGDFESFLEMLAGIGSYTPLHQKRCQKRPRNVDSQATGESENTEKIVLGPGVLELVQEMRLKQGVSTSLSRLSQLGVLVKFRRIKAKASGPRVVYGMPEWLSADGRPLPQFKEQLIGFKRI